MMQKHRTAYRRQAINGSHRQINATGNDDEGGADGHDGKERGVLGQNVQVVCPQEFINGMNGPGVRIPELQGTAKNGQGQSQCKQDAKQASFFETHLIFSRLRTGNGG